MPEKQIPSSYYPIYAQTFTSFGVSRRDRVAMEAMRVLLEQDVKNLVERHFDKLDDVADRVARASYAVADAMERVGGSETSHELTCQKCDGDGSLLPNGLACVWCDGTGELRPGQRHNETALDHRNRCRDARLAEAEQVRRRHESFMGKDLD